MYVEKYDPNIAQHQESFIASNRAQMIGLCGAIAGVFTLVCMILLWVFYYRTRYGLILFFAIMACIIFVLCLFIAAMGFKIKRDINNENPEHKLITSLVYIFSVLSSAFLLINVASILILRYTHFNYLLGTHENTATFKTMYPTGSNFESAWVSDRRFMWWISFFSVFSAVLLGFCACLMWSVSKFMIQLARALLAMAAAGSILFLGFAYYRLNQVIKGASNHSTVNEIFSDNDWTSLKWTIIITAAFLFINLIVNVLKKKLLYFILGLFLMVLVIILAIKAGLILRRYRQAIQPGEQVTNLAIKALPTYYEEDIKGACNKYLPVGSSCGKQYDSVEVESGSTKRSLNPICARVARAYILHSAYLASVFCLFAAAFALVVFSSDFYLSNTNEFLETYNRSTTPYEILGCVLGFIFIAITLFWTGLSDVSSLQEAKSTFHSDNLQERLARGEVSEPDYMVVPQSVIDKGSQAASICTPYDSSKMVSVTKNSACTFSKCGYRMFILGEATSFAGVAESVQGPQTMRSVAFPNALNSKDGFLFLHGTADEVNNNMKSLRFCQKQYNKDLSLFYKIEEVDLSKLGSQGEKPGESPAGLTMSESGNRGFPTGYTLGSNQICQSSSICTFENRLAAPSGRAIIGGNIYAKNTGGVYVTAPQETLKTLKLEATHEGQIYTSIPAGSFDTSGTLLFDVPASNNVPYILSIAITDTSGHYLPYNKEVVINSVSSSQVSLGKIPLILPSGAGCVSNSNYAGCLASNKVEGKGNIKVQVLDSATNKPLTGATVELNQGFYIGSGALVKSATTDDQGYAYMNSVAYNYYTITAKNSTSTYDTQTIVHDTATTTGSNMYIHEHSNYMMYISMIINSDDTDVKVKVVNSKGTECVVSSENKYCAYVLYFHDVTSGHGIESIGVYNLTDSHYMVYSEKVEKISGGCGSLEGLNAHFGEIARTDIDWTEVTGVSVEHTASTDKYWIAYCFTGFGQQSVKNVNKGSSTDPNISECTKLYPDSDQYSVSRLVQAIRHP